MVSRLRWFVPRWLSAAHHARRLPKRSAARNQRKLLIETLETRAMLAHDITIAAGGSLTIPAGATSFSDTGDYTIAPTAISAATANIVLEANTDVTINAAITTGFNLTIKAGRSIIDNQANITVTSQNISLVANDTTADGVTNANRDAGAATINLSIPNSGGGSGINAFDGNVTITLNTGAGLTNSTSGNIVVSSEITAFGTGGGTIVVQNDGPTAGSSITDPAQLSEILAPSIAFDVNGAGGGGSIGTASAPIGLAPLDGSLLAARSQSGGIFFNNVATNSVTIGAVNGLHGLSTSANGNILLGGVSPKISQNITISDQIDAGTGTVYLAALGNLSETSGGSITAGALDLFTTSSLLGNNIVLEQANNVGTLAAANSSSGGAISFDNSQALTVGTVTSPNTTLVPTQSGITANNGDVNVASAGLAINQAIAAGTGIIRLVQTANVTQTSPGTISGNGFSVNQKTAGDTVNLGLTNHITVAFATSGLTGATFTFNNSTSLSPTMISAASAQADPLGLFPAVGMDSLAIITQPPATVTAGSAFGTTVAVEDSLGNVVTGFTGNITVSLGNNPGSSTLGGTLTVAATAGLAVFSNLTLNKVGAGYTLDVTSPSLTSATSSAITVAAGAATQLVLSTAFPQNVTVNAPFGFTVLAEDAEGNVASSFSSSMTVAISTNPGSGTLGGTTTVTTTGGVAAFSGLALNQTGTGYQLSVNSGGLPVLPVGPFNVTATGVATHLVVVTSPPATTSPGTAFGLTVEAEDDFGAEDPSFNGTVTVALANNPGASTLSGTLTATASAGSAVFSGLSLNNPGAGYTLQTTASGLTAGTTSPFNVVGTLTITGVANDNINIAFTDATHFFVSINGVSTNYSTATATKVVYNGPTGSFSQVVCADIFNPYAATQTFTSTKITENGFEFDANDVKILYVYVSNNASTATVTVGTGTDNNFYVGAANGGYSYIGDPALGLYSELSGFGSETVAGSAGTTYAYVYSTSHAAFVGDPGGSTFTATGLTLNLSNFSQVYAVGANDGTDTITLHTQGGSFVGSPAFDSVGGTFNSNTFVLGALYAANVIVQATHATESGFFYSFQSNTFNGAVGSSSLSGNTGTFSSSVGFSSFLATATGFQSITVLESGSKTDVANVTSPGNGTFTSTPTVSTLVVGSVTVITVNTFVNSNGSIVAVPANVVATGNANGTDTANIYDSVGSNTLIAGGNQASLNPGGAPRATVKQFGTVNAFQQNGNNDTVQEAAIDYVLNLIGSWTKG